MTISKYRQLALVRWKVKLFSVRRSALFLTGVLVILVIVFLIKGLIPQQLSTTPTAIVGQITGLPSIDDEGSSVTVIQILDTGTAGILAIEESEGIQKTYEIATTPGFRIVFANVFDRQGSVAYEGTSEAKRAIEGQKNIMNVAIADKVSRLVVTAAYAVEPKPTFGIMIDETNTYWEPETPIMQSLFDGYKMSDNPRSENFDNINIVGLSNKASEALDVEYGLMRQGLIRPEDVHEFTPLDPNFLIKVKGNVIKKPLYPNSARLETYDTTEYDIVLIDVASGKVLGSGRYSESFVDDWDFVKKSAADFVDRIVNGDRPDAIKLPDFTESFPTPTKDLPSEHAKRFIDLAKNAVPEVAGGSQPLKPAVPTPATGGKCDFDGFVSCRDTFNLQGCIDACPLVNKSCPEGTPPDTECKETDEECSNNCWDQGNSHASQCAAVNNCSMQEIEKKLQAQ